MDTFKSNKDSFIWIIFLCTVFKIVLANNNDTLCGYIDFDPETKVNIYEGLGISPWQFNEIYNKFSNTSTVTLVKDSSDCFIEICGHPTILLKGERVIIPSCARIFEENSSLPLPKNPFQVFSSIYITINYPWLITLLQNNYEATSIQCGCKVYTK